MEFSDLLLVNGRIATQDDRHSFVNALTIKNGRVVEGNFDTYPVVRLKDAPKTEVHLALTGGKKWGGVGEPGAAVIPAAVTNAIFAATGKRIRSLPIKGQNLSGAA